jgi:hypothetical protein
MGLIHISTTFLTSLMITDYFIYLPSNYNNGLSLVFTVAF